jgi:hypothetical protein
VIVRLVAVALVCTSCPKGDLRGFDERTPDGGTLLVIDDDNGGGCTLWVDGRAWKHPKGVAAPVKPGAHTVDCGDKPSPGNAYDVRVREGHTWHFTYWGP